MPAQQNIYYSYGERLDHRMLFKFFVFLVIGGILVQTTTVTLLLFVLAIVFLFSIVTKIDFLFIILLLSPFLPDIFRTVLNIPVINDITIYLGLAIFVSVFLAQKGIYEHKVLPKNVTLYIILIMMLVTASAFRAVIRDNADFAEYMVPMAFSQLVILSFIIFSYNYFLYRSAKNFSYFFLVIIIFICLSFLADKALYGIDKTFGGYIGTGNTVGNVLVISLPLYITILNRYQVKHKLVFISLPVVSILLSQSRGAAFAFFILVFAYFISKINIKWPYKTILFIVATAFVSVIFYDTISYYFEYAADLRNTEMIELSTGRYHLWDKALILLSDSQIFLFGDGTNAFLAFNQKVFYSGINVQNHFLKIWTESGIIGLIFAIIFYGKIIKLSISMKSKIYPELKMVSTSVLYSCIAFLTVGIFSHFDVGSMFSSILFVQTGWMLALFTKSQRMKDGQLK